MDIDEKQGYETVGVKTAITKNQKIPRQFFPLVMEYIFEVRE